MRNPLFTIFRLAQRLIGGRLGRGYASLPVIGGLYRWALRAVKPRGIVTVRFGAGSLDIDADDPGHTALLLGTHYNDAELSLCEAHCLPGTAALDVGANVGAFTVTMARAVGPEGHVWAFEPAPHTATLLRRNVEQNRLANVTVAEQAVSDQAGSCELRLSPTSSGDHALSGQDGWTTVAVQTTTLDEATASEVRPISLVKLDVQGAEPAVLRGMRRMLGASPAMKLIVELDPVGIAAYGEDPEGFLIGLTDEGLSLWQIELLRGEPKLSPISPLDALRLCETHQRHINLFCARGLSF